MNNIVEGKKIATQLVEQLHVQIAAMKKRPVLGLVVVGTDQVTNSYIRIKQKTAEQIGVEFKILEIVDDVSNEMLQTQILGFLPEVDGLVLQLPLPGHIDRDVVLRMIPADKDIDALNPDNDQVVGPVALSVMEIIDYHRIDLTNKKIVLMGQGNLVGRPVGQLLKRQGYSFDSVDETMGAAQVSALLASADVVVSGVGQPGLVAVDQIKDGVILIDAGTSASSGSVVGDIDPQCATKAALFATTPGGVGPITIAKLFENLVNLYTR